MAEPPGAPGVDPGVSDTESIAVLRDSTSSRLLQPVRHGGRAASRSASEAADFVVAVAGLAERDGSGGWLAGALNAAAYAVAGLDDAAAERVWGADTAALVTACAEPAGRLTTGRGKRRLTGRWESVTGAVFADWMLLSALDEDDRGSVRYVLLPRDAVQIDRHAHRRGLDAAGIGDVTVSDMIVDAVFSHPDESPSEKANSVNPRSRTPFWPVPGRPLPWSAPQPACGGHTSVRSANAWPPRTAARTPPN